MLHFDFERLRSMGLTPALIQQAELLAAGQSPVAADVCATPADPATAANAGAWPLLRLTEVHRDRVRLHDGAVEHAAQVLPRLMRALTEQDTALAVGDWVLAAPDAHGQWWVAHRVPPQTHLVRRDADGRRHPVASNVDTALLVMGLDEDFNLRRLERFIALVQGRGITPVVVLSKADAVRDAPTLYARVQQVRQRIPDQMDLYSVDARDPDTALRLAVHARPGQTLVLVGSSGAGKSTLTNTLLGAVVQDTGAVREHDSRGKHTTTARSLLRLPGGACVIDTPGLRALRPDADEGAVAATFGDINHLAAQCRFRNCRHQGEPGCQVREGVDEDRLRNFHKLLREARRDSMTALERQQQIAAWKARGRAGRQRARQKRGDE
ncbi:MAG: ribosome small subunit-dependent GTPase A [Ideonella sp.]|jgi:ribosome biogenesis GTPase / thiamine phosphate phosphatase|nr:ribosome small subunit-dependent GTPase A [Ideonella sp.]MBL0151508.1 ribosome small subunit-dependent GTPase A [Ideonella sp.]